MYAWPQRWKLQLLSYAEDNKHGINDLLLRYMYDITISVKTLPLLEEHQLVFYITYKLLKSNPKKPKDKHGSLYYLNPSLDSSGEEIQSWDFYFLNYIVKHHHQFLDYIPFWQRIYSLYYRVWFVVIYWPLRSLFNFAFIAIFCTVKTISIPFIFPLILRWFLLFYVVQEVHIHEKETTLYLDE